jgi:hypothetical protein
MNHSLRTTMFALSTTLVMAAGAYADEPFAYEGFDYGSSPNLLGKNGGSGWSTAWGKINQITTGVIDEDLAYPGLATTGGSAITPPFPSNDFTAYSRGLDPYDTSSGEVYVSFLFRPNIGFGFGGGVAFGPFTNGMVVGADNDTGLYGLRTPPGELSADSDVAMAQGDTVLLVAHIEATETGTTWSLYVNPTVGDPEPTTAAATLDVPMALPPNAMIFNDGGFSTDEIRFGLTWDSVLPAAAACIGDLDGSGEVDGADLGLLLTAWETPEYDLNGDGTTDSADLGLLLSAWGSCI